MWILKAIKGYLISEEWRRMEYLIHIFIYRLNERLNTLKIRKRSMDSHTLSKIMIDKIFGIR
jgi:hypothetical protein